MPAQPAPARRLSATSHGPAPVPPGSAPADTGPGPATTSDETAGDEDPTFRHAYTRDRAQLLRRLRRIEGQVRGIARMVEREEYCVDILQQTSALRAAVDAVALLILEDHVQGCVRTAAERGEADRYVEEVLDVVRRSLGRPIRGGARG
jgi:CsoR family transcriptional regulator, copper-sensing transcriptional repressor